jgi:hypothetical protein
LLKTRFTYIYNLKQGQEISNVPAAVNPLTRASHCHTFESRNIRSKENTKGARALNKYSQILNED